MYASGNIIVVGLQLRRGDGTIIGLTLDIDECHHKICWLRLDSSVGSSQLLVFVKRYKAAGTIRNAALGNQLLNAGVRLLLV